MREETECQLIPPPPPPISTLQEVVAGTHPVLAGSLHALPLCDGGFTAAERWLPWAQRSDSDRCILHAGLPGSNAGTHILRMPRVCLEKKHKLTQILGNITR